MKKFIILTITTLISWTAFSQTDTNKVHISVNTAKKIAAELVLCDTIKTKLQTAIYVIDLQDQKITLKDSVIREYGLKVDNYKKQIQNYDSACTEYKKVTTNLKKENTSLSIQNSLFKKSLIGTSIGSIGFIITLLLLF